MNHEYSITLEASHQLLEFARRHFAEQIFIHLSHCTLNDQSRWLFDAEVARRELHSQGIASKIIEEKWPVDFVGLLTYVHSWSLFDEISERGVRGEEVMGIRTKRYLSGFSNHDFQKAFYSLNEEQKRVLFDKMFGEPLWERFESRVIYNYGLIHQGYTLRRELLTRPNNSSLS